MKTGVVYLKIRLELEQDLTEKQVQDLVEDLDYTVTDKKRLIQNTELVRYAISADEPMND